jgi:hypothetical protein
MVILKRASGALKPARQGYVGGGKLIGHEDWVRLRWTPSVLGQGWSPSCLFVVRRYHASVRGRRGGRHILGDTKGGFECCQLEIPPPLRVFVVHSGCALCRERMMQGQSGFWDLDERYERLSAVGDSLEKLNAIIPWPVFEKPLAKALKRSDGSKGGRPPFPVVMMFKIVVVQALYSLSYASPPIRTYSCRFPRRTEPVRRIISIEN